MKQTIKVPNVLAADIEDVEKFYAEVMGLPNAERYAFDMSIVDFVRPYGAIALVVAARFLSKISGQAVRLENLGDRLFHYLERMDIFNVGGDWLHPNNTLLEEWNRNPRTPNLLELTTIGCAKDVETVVSRSERIFAEYLKPPDLCNLLMVLSELCTNIYEHSGDRHGCVLIQKYHVTAQELVIIRLAAGDLGCGIRGSLVNRYGVIGNEPLDYLHEAMSGQRTARLSGRGGLGLRTIEQLAGKQGGYLWLRSETTGIFTRNPDKRRGQKDLVHMSGTQVAVEIHAPLKI